jgi:hypothetical protein
MSATNDGLLALRMEGGSLSDVVQMEEELSRQTAAVAVLEVCCNSLPIPPFSSFVSSCWLRLHSFLALWRSAT